MTMRFAVRVGPSMRGNDACNESGGLGWLPGSEAYGYSFTALSDGHVLVRMTAAGVTPLDHTILFGQYPNAKAPLVLGNEGAGIVEGGGTVEYPTGSRVMFTGPCGVLENGTLSELVAVQREHLCLVTDNVEDAAAAGLPVAYLTAFLTLKAA